MNSSNIKAIPALIVLILGTIFLAADIFAGGGNQISRTLGWGMILGAIFGLGFPRYAVLVFFAILYYLDFVKRMLVIGDGVTSQDVMVSLGFGPVIIVAVCMNCTARAAVGLIPYRHTLDILFFIGCVLISILGWFLAESDLLVSRGHSLLGTALIGMTALACYCLFRSKDDVRTVIKCLVLAGIPMAFYTIWQFIFGIADWEERYIRTGASAVLYNHWLVAGGSEGIRPFSTLNLHPSVGAVSGVMFLLAVTILARSKEVFATVRNKKLTYWAIGLLYLTSCVLSQNRTTYFIPVFYLIFAWAFRGGFRTLLVYLGGLAAGIFVIAKSSEINDQILNWSATLEKTTLGRNFGTLGTYQDRLSGFESLTDERYWKAFGLPESVRPFTHDLLSGSLFRFGYVPVASVILCAAILLIWWHFHCLRVTDDTRRNLLRRLTAILASLALCGVAYGNLLFVAPVNAFLGAIAGLAMAIFRQELVEMKASDRLSTVCTPPEVAVSGSKQGFPVP